MRIDGRAVMFGHIDVDSPALPAVGESLPDDVGMHAMDHGLLHGPCARVALAHCPALRDMRSRGLLVALDVPAGSIEAFGEDAIVIDLDG